MKFFIDTANLEAIKQADKMGILDGVTTNPSLVSKEGVNNFKEHIRKICEITDGPVSAEVIALDYEGMMRQAREVAAIAKNVVVKIPMTEAGIKAVAHLENEGIQTNVTLVFSPSQALLAAKVGASYISPFLGRIDDTSWDALTLVENIMQILVNYGFESEVIAASIRHPKHIFQVAKAGCHIATVPFSVLNKLYNHPLTDIGIKRFMDDWEKLDISF